MNRAQRRQKNKNRLFTKKGYTRVVHVDKDGRATNIPTKQGSALQKRAIRNVKRLKKSGKGSG